MRAIWQTPHPAKALCPLYREDGVFQKRALCQAASGNEKDTSVHLTFTCHVTRTRTTICSYKPGIWGVFVTRASPDKSCLIQITALTFNLLHQFNLLQGDKPERCHKQLLGEVDFTFQYERNTSWLISRFARVQQYDIKLSHDLHQWLMQRWKKKGVKRMESRGI